jgi:hypothetical protein
MARLPIPPINPNNPIPNNPFFYPDQNYIQGEYSPFIVGSGLSIDNVTGTISASGVGASLAAGPGISLTTVGTITTITNTGLAGITATSPVNVTAGATPDVSVDAASTTQPGVVQLANTTTSSSVSQALTAAAGYSLQQQIDALVISNNLTLAGTVSGGTGFVATVTAEGAAKGFSVGSQLPTAAAGNAEYFVIVTTAGTMTPPGGVATAVNQGDWWVSNGTSWVYYPVGFDPVYATTTSPGVVQLATNAEVQAGTESTHAVTSSALQSKLSDSVNLASSTCIASSTAVKTANDAAAAAQTDATNALSQVALAQADATQALSDAATAQFTANAAIPCACYTAKGDILGGTGAGAFSVLSPGTDGQMLYALSSATNGLQWAAPPADIPCAVITAIGDIVVGTGPSTPTALPVGANGYILAANSACTTGLEWVANSENDVTSVTGTLPITVDNTNPQTPIVGVNAATTSSTGVVSVGTNINVSGLGAISVPAATTTSQGAVQVGTNINVTSGTISVPAATTAAQGAVQVGTNINVTAGTISVPAATTAAQGAVQVGTNIQVAAGTISVLNATTAQQGVVQLNDTTNSTSTTLALTAAQGKNLQDQITALSITSNITLGGTYNANTGLVDSVTAQGTTAGLTVGSALPAPSALNNEIFVIVDVQGTNGPNSPTLAHIGDWFLSNGTTWQFLNVGFAPGQATTVSEGVVQLATDAEVQAGTDSSNAVVSSSLQSKLSDSTSTTSSTTIASSTAVKAAYDLAAAAIPCSAVTAKGNIIAATGSGAPVALPVGTDGQILYANSACSTGLEWGIRPITCLDFDAKGDLLAGAGPDSFATLGVGTDGQVLYACSTAATGLCWAAAGSTPAATPTVLGTLFGCSLSTGTSGTALGYCALGANPTGGCNVAVGTFAGRNLSTGQWNVFIGGFAGATATTATASVAIGINAAQLSNGSGSIAIGNSAGYRSGNDNVTVGSASMSSTTTTTTRTVAVGSNTARFGSANDNVAIGFGAACVPSDGGCNTVVGSGALQGVGITPTVAPCNTSLGYRTLNAATTACLNVALGFAAGCSITSGAQNVLIGPNVGTTCTTQSCTLAIGYSNTALWLTGDSTNAIKPGAGIIDCAGSCGTAGQVLTSNGSNAIAWANNTAPKVYTANKALTSGTPINLLSWTGSIRMGTLAVFATDNSSNVKWANITVGSATGIGSTAVITQSVGVGNFTITAGGGGETIVTFTPSTTLASVDFVYQYNAAFGAQPSVL